VNGEQGPAGGTSGGEGGRHLRDKITWRGQTMLKKKGPYRNASGRMPNVESKKPQKSQ